MSKFFTLSFLFLAVTVVSAQDDLMKELEKGQKPETNYAVQTFRGTRIINGQSVETKGKGELEFIFSHRFGRINTGAYNMFGLDGNDGINVRLGLEYGITDRLSVAIGRSSFLKDYDAYARYKLVSQSSGVKNFPVTITVIGTAVYRAFPNAADASQASIPLPSTGDRMGYVIEVPIARKFSSKFSAQVTPVFVHRNAVDKNFENNDDYAVGFAARYKVTKSMSLIGEYYSRMNAHTNTPYYNSAGLGFDIETGGHVFQVVFTNSMGLNTRTVITETAGDINNGDVRFGFNITRTFQLTKRKQ